MRNQPNIEVRVDLDQDAIPSAVGRNGTTAIGAVVVWTGESGLRTYVDMISKAKGHVLHAGFALAASDMDKLAAQWLRKRGYTSIPKTKKVSV